MKPDVSLYEPQPSDSLIRVTYIEFDFEKRIYPSWYSVIRGTRMCCHYHLHQNMEIIIMKEGHVEFQVSGKKYDLRENDVLIINPFEPHSAIIPKDCDRTVYYALNFDMSRLSGIPSKKIKTISEMLINGNAHYSNIPDAEICEDVFDTSVGIADRENNDELLQLSLLIKVFAILGEPESNDFEKENKRSDKFIRNTITYIQSTPLQDVSLEAISEQFSYNKAYFTTIFKKNFGMTFTDYLNNYKVNIAKGHIRNGNYNLNDVAERSGFNYYAYFFKKFKAIVGVSPSEFVDMCRANTERESR